MTLRMKLLLAELPLGLALAAVGLIAVLTISSLGSHSQRILAENYRSVLAAQRMKESIERLDGAAKLAVVGRRDRGRAQALAHRRQFQTELAVEEGNITEPGEARAARRLRAAWTEYLQAFDRFMALPEPALRDRYFGEMEPKFTIIKTAADEVLTINQDAMVRKSDEASRASARMNSLMTAVSIAALLVGMIASFWLTTRLLRPLTRLSQAAHRIGEIDLDTRVAVSGSDEIAQLAHEFNEMAARLEQYRRSTLGDLLRAQETSQAAIDSIADPVIVLAVDGTVISTNQAADALVHLAQVPSGQHPLALVEPPLRAAIERVRDHVLAGKGPYVPQGFEEAVRATAEGVERYFIARASPLYGERKGISGVTILLQDVTRFRRFDELKDDLVATVAHEFRTPLTSLHMAIHLCLEEAAGPLTEKQADLLHAGRQDCERLQTIVDDMLDLARLQAGKVVIHRRPTAARELVDSAAEAQLAAARQRQIVLERQVMPSLDEVSADPERIGLVLSNLLSNALRHTPPGGTITLRALASERGVRFEVRDTGEGIAAEHLGRVFDRFYRVPGSSSGGAGLGLSICREIVQAHGGELGVESTSGAGSTFWFVLPLVPPEPPAST